MRICFSVLMIALFSVSCGYDSDRGNATLTIHNDANGAIIVFYSYGEECCEDSSLFFDDDCEDICLEEGVVKVDRGKSKTIDIDIDFWDGEIDVQYLDIVKTFDIDFDIFGFASIHINTSDFSGSY